MLRTGKIRKFTVAMTRMLALPVQLCAAAMSWLYKWPPSAKHGLLSEGNVCIHAQRGSQVAFADAQPCQCAAAGASNVVQSQPVCPARCSGWPCEVQSGN